MGTGPDTGGPSNSSFSDCGSGGRGLGLGPGDSASESHSTSGENARGLEEEPLAPGPPYSLVKASFSERLSTGPRTHQLFSFHH